MAEIAIDELLRRQRTMADQAAALANERDVDRIQAITRALETEARALEELARAFEQQELAKAGPPPRGALEVVLTPEQIERVNKQTGVTLASVVIPDETGVLSRAMPTTDPREIERYALREAGRLRSLRDADGQMRAEVARAIAEIESQASGELRQQLEQLKADPKWLGGILAQAKADGTAKADGAKAGGDAAKAGNAGAAKADGAQAGGDAGAAKAETSSR